MGLIQQKCDFWKNMMVNNLKDKKYSAIILAAGLSTRMGSSKMLLQFNAENKFIEQIVKTYQEFGCENIYIVTNESTQQLIEKQSLELKNSRLIINQHPEWQKFHSLQLAVAAMNSMNLLQDTFIQNIDNPFVNPQVLALLVENRTECDYIVPTFNGRGGHPFLASKNIMETVLQTDNVQTHFKQFMQQFPSKRVPIEDERIIVNINNREEYQKWFPNN